MSKMNNTTRFFATLLTATVIAILAPAPAAHAVQIDGDISFTGAYTIDNNINLALATSFLTYNNVTVLPTQAHGSYAGTDGVSVTFSPFTFAGPSPDSGVTPLWTFTIGATTFSFDATTITVPFANNNNLVVEGVGIAHITGFDDTPGFWNISANKAGNSFSFSSAAAAVGIPEPATLGLTALGLTTLLLRRRKA